METLSRLNSYTDALKCRNLKGWCTRKRGSLGSLDSGYASNSGNSIETQPKTYESTETSDITTREFQLQLKLQSLEAQNQKYVKEILKLTGKCEQISLENNILRKKVENSEPEYTKDLFIKFQENIDKERKETEKTYNDKITEIAQNMKEKLENSEVNDKVGFITAENLTVETIKNGEIESLVIIGNYFQNIERFEENIQTKIFLKHVTPTIITLLGGKDQIKDLTLNEIKNKVLEHTQEIDSVERLIELQKIKWNGKIDPLIFKQNLNQTYKMLNHDNSLELSLDEVLRKCLTSKMKGNIKDTWESLFNKNPEETMGKVIKMFNRYGKNYFFYSESKFLNTPYQGKKRCLGIFKCTCQRSWTSIHSYSNKSQKCLQCQTQTYPKNQYPLTNHTR